VADFADPLDVRLRPNRVQRWIQRLAMIAWVTPRLAPLVHAVDERLLAWSGDRLCLTTPLTGLPVMRVTTTGARSGLPRTHPLTALRQGEWLALIGSNFGRRCLPAWFHNLHAHPVAWIHRAGGVDRFAARPASAEEYDRFWSRAVAVYPGYAAYARRAAPRKVPILVLTPVDRG
jgi:deazaflavin-dependent oxidoreductase (nitroreductase family)